MSRIIKKGKCKFALLDANTEVGNTAPMDAPEGEAVNESEFNPFLSLLPGKEESEREERQRLEREKGDHETVAVTDRSNSTQNQEKEEKTTHSISPEELKRMADEANAMKREAEKILEEARKRAEEMESQAYAAGYEQGQKDGLEIGRQQYQIKIQHLDSVIQEIEKQRTELLEQENEAQMVILALAVAQKTVEAVINLDHYAIAEAVRAAVKYVAKGSAITIHLHPRDLASIQESGDISNNPLGLGKILLKENDQISRGGCIVESDFGLIDATVQSKWAAVMEEIERALKDRTGLSIPSEIKTLPVNNNGRDSDLNQAEHEPGALPRLSPEDRDGQDPEPHA